MDTAPTFDDYEDEGGSTLDLKVLLLYGAYRSKGRLLVCTFLGVVGGLLYAASMPNEFQSVAQVKMLPDSRGGMTQEEAYGIGGSGKERFGPGVADLVFWMRLQDSVFSEVSQSLSPSWILGPANPTRDDTAETSPLVAGWHQLQAFMQTKDGKAINDESPKAIQAAAEAIRNRTLIKRTSDWVFMLTVVSNSAVKAQVINYQLTQGFLAQHRRTRAEAGLALVKKLEADAWEAQLAVETTGQEFQEFRRSCGVFDFTADWAAINALVAQKRSDLIDKGAALEGQRKLVAHLTERHAAMPDDVEVEIPATMGINPYWSGIKDKILGKRTTLAELQGKAQTTVNKSAIKALTSVLEGLEGELEGVEQTVELAPARTDLVMNEAKFSLEVLLVEAEGERDRLESELSVLPVQLAEAEQKREEIGACKVGHADWEQRLERKTAAHQRIAARLLVARQQVKLDESGETNLKLWLEPTLNLDKIGPKRSKILLGGLAIGLLLGLGLAVMRQLFDPRVRYPETLEKTLGLKVLAVVPDLRRLRNYPKRARADQA